MNPEGIKDLVIQQTHQARLVCIEEIKKCEHPRDQIRWDRTCDHTHFGPSEVAENYFRWKCTCGAEVRPKGFEEVVP